MQSETLHRTPSAPRPSRLVWRRCLMSFHRRCDVSQLVWEHQCKLFAGKFAKEDKTARSMAKPYRLKALAACRTEVFSGVATSGILPAIGKLAGRRAGVEAILAQRAGL